MGKNKKGNTKNIDLGRSLIRGKNAERRNAGRTVKKDSWLHTSELQDGYDWNRLNLQSVTEQNTLDEFLETAALAGVEFTAEKLNVKIVGAGNITGVLGEAEKLNIKQKQEENKQFLTIPRRPAWDESTSPEELNQNERDSFLNWRRSLALLQESEELLLTPYEKNLDVWRQLWRVIERSDVVCQIVDGRNPLLYKCDDLENYVKEVNSLKEFIILINKADYLSEKQRSYWADYFSKEKTKVLFWSALDQANVETEETPENEHKGNIGVDDDDDEDDDDQNEDELSEEADQNDNLLATNLEQVSISKDSEGSESSSSTNIDRFHSNTTDLVSRKDLLNFFKSFPKTNADDKNDHITIGLVGYPNVGKSSTLNALLQEKKAAVSATPGKTKHFQTLFIDEELCLCDCPGLVFPTFVSTKADMVLNGILPIDQLRDYIAPSTILTQLIPRKIIENTYGVNIAKPKEGEDPNRVPTYEEMLCSYSSMRGYMTAHGLPDCPRAARYVLKDFVKGKLLYCHPPPGVSGEDYEPCTMSEKAAKRMIEREEKELKKIAQGKYNPVSQTSAVDEEFFEEKPPEIHFKAPTGSSLQQPSTGNEQYMVHKPWKKHGNRNKKEKLRRLYDKK